MDTAFLLAQIDRLKHESKQASNDTSKMWGVKAQIKELISEAVGRNSSFFELADQANGSEEYLYKALSSALENFQSYVQAGLLGQVSIERKAQLEVVSDLLEQAHLLLKTNGVHPAAPIVLIGATLEEFLRTWVETKALQLGNRKPCLDTYAQLLFADDLITKQDLKDITAWGGLRNHAAHGEWDEVSDKQRAAIMLDGVNLFMRKYGA